MVVTAAVTIGAAVMKDIFKAYLVTNSATGKQYVGITTQSIRRRWSHHVFLSKKLSGQKLHQAMSQYGLSSFSIEHIASAPSFEYLLKLEIYLIDQFGTLRSGYNLTKGGNGHLGLSPSKNVLAERSARLLKLYSNIDERRMVSALVSAAKMPVSPPPGKYDAPLSAGHIRTGSPAIRTIEMRERMRAGRLRFLSSGPSANAKSGKLSPQHVGEIRWLLANSPLTQGEIGIRYGVRFTQISNIKCGRCWPGVEPIKPAVVDFPVAA